MILFIRYRALEVVASKLEAFEDTVDLSADLKNLLPSLLKVNEQINDLFETIWSIYVSFLFFYMVFFALKHYTIL